MKFSNPRVPDDINVSPHKPLREVLVLGGGVVTLVVVVTLALTVFGGVVARQIPFGWERALAERVASTPFHTAEAPAALRRLVDDLVVAMDLPADARITVHPVRADVPNAFAALGGHIFVFSGLIERLPNENALAMVLAHEIAHVAHRDVVEQMGSGLLLSLAFAAVTGGARDTAAALLQSGGELVVRGFSRHTEAAADAAALAALAEHYGHVAGAADLFRVFAEIEADAAFDAPDWLSTHPDSDDRVAAIAALARDNGWPTDGPLRPLPPELTSR